MYGPVIGVKNALDDILDKVKLSFEKLFPIIIISIITINNSS